MKTFLMTALITLMTPSAFALRPADLTRDWCNYSIENGQAKVFYKIQLLPKNVLKIVRESRVVVSGSWRISGADEVTFSYRQSGGEYPHGKLSAEYIKEEGVTALSLSQDENSVLLNACSPGE